jgi:hypothetical protein
MSQASMSPGSANTLRFSTDGGRGEDLYSLWNSVFDGMHVVDSGPNAEQPAPQLPFQGLVQVGVQARVEAHMSDTEVAGKLSPADERQVAMQSAVDAADNALHASTAAATDTSDAVVVAITPVATDDADAPNAQASTSTAQETLGASQDRLASSDVERLVSDESAHVFVRGAAVAIVVRNPALSDQDAINSAFETAHELTGQRSALLRLTLNGRTLYEQADEVGERGATPASALVFAC